MSPGQQREERPLRERDVDGPVAVAGDVEVERAVPAGGDLLEARPPRRIVDRRQQHDRSTPPARTATAPPRPTTATRNPVPSRRVQPPPPRHRRRARADPEDVPAPEGYAGPRTRREHRMSEPPAVLRIGSARPSCPWSSAPRASAAIDISKLRAQTGARHPRQRLREHRARASRRSRSSTAKPASSATAASPSRSSCRSRCPRSSRPRTCSSTASSPPGPSSTSSASASASTRSCTRT